MAARKKVTKKAPKAPERSRSVRQKQKAKRDATAKRGSAADSQGKAKATRRAGTAGKAESSQVISAATPKKVAPAAVAVVSAKAGVKAAATAPRKSVGADNRSEPKAVAAIDLNRRSEKTTNPGPATPGALRSESAAAPVVTGAAVTAPAVVGVKPALAAAAVLNGTAKTVKTSSPGKAIDREPSGGEQKTMKNSANKHGFKLNEFVVYPAHGVGQIVAMEEQEVAGFKLELFVINFVKDKMTLRVPTSKVAGVGMRKLSDPDAARRSLEILTGRARIKRTMWSRRAQEYEAKINSGDINAIAEVVRDLFRSDAQPEQSYSERQLYEAALDRMMREIAAVQKLSETEALKVIDAQLKKNQKRGVKADAAEGDEAGIEEAA